MKKFTLSFLIILIFLSSCGNTKSVLPNTQPFPSPAGKWNLKLTQSGGIAGVQLTVEVNSDGLLKAENQRSQQIVTKILSSQTVIELKKLIFNTISSASRTTQSACADCFIYDLEIQLDGSNIKIHVDDITINKSGAQELIAKLIGLRDEALKPNP